MVVTQTKFAELAGVSRQAVSKVIRAGGLVVRPDKKLDTVNPVNHDYLNRDRDNGITTAESKSKSKPKKTKSAKSKPKNDESESAEIDLDNIPENLNGLMKSELERVKVAEQILDLRQKRQIARDDLISRKLIRSVFSKFYEIDMNEFLTLKDKLMPDIAAIFEVNDPKLQMKAGERMDEELWKILKHIQRVKNDFLKNVKSEELE